MSEEAPSSQTFTSADRIRQLIDIDQDVAKLIQSAGLAIQALTNTKPDSPSAPSDGSLESHKIQFKEATTQYFSLLSSIDVRLRRQVYALEEASLLAPETASRTGDATGTGAGGLGAGTGSGSGAANPLDISWLNSRKDTVGKDKEAELWAAARGFVEQLGKSPGGQNGSAKQVGESEMMQVD
ncbi:uncharacterized protein N7482_008047 [Penicillium canariense]|uniref:Mediator of RNA polymerase II transcription subunit 11 n=1 Tax=Penicillium canariense TaxID=189055 RepID=A0A9W9HT81_9EURO|nr:uncharacterized protein N7482_008047 [Penicillium canariense]KAJ5156947.1 hypothetical protein N7482_008047 [Penicillium canariense]